MKIEAVSGYRVRPLLPQQIRQAQINQIVRSELVKPSSRINHRYGKKIAQRRVWLPARSPRAPAYHSIGLFSIDHSPYELSINDIEIDDPDALVIENNRLNQVRKRMRSLRRWEKFQRQRKGRLKGCLRYPKKK